MPTLRVSNSPQTVLRQMNRLQQSQSSIDEIILTIDFDGNNFVKPLILALLVAFVEQLRLKHAVQVLCINMNTNIIDYIARMDFFRQVDFDYNETFMRLSSSGKFIPITRITSDNRGALINEFIRIIESKWQGIDKNILASLNWSIYEIIDNIFNHASSEIDGLIVAQYTPSWNDLSLMIIDGGIGIPNRLRQRDEYKHLSLNEALDLAVEKDVTVDPQTNKGAGLFYTKRIIEENRGKMVIRSGDAHLIVNNGRKKVVTGGHWSGTIVELEIKTNVMIDPQKIWGNLPPSVEDYLLDGTLW